MTYKIINKDNIEYLKTQPDDSFDSIVTDPPYGIEFLDKDWDKNTGAVETWQECLRVLKPGGHLLAFSSARTYHHLATNIEQVGFEIRDQLMWLYSSGFPKAQKIKGHEGWKTALKPAHEPIVMARKPFRGSTYNNMDHNGVGALNIDESRIPYENQKDFDIYVNNIKGPLERSTAKEGDNIGMHEGKTGFKRQKGRVVMPQGGVNGWSRVGFGEKEPEKYRDQKPKPLKKGKDPRNRLIELDGTQVQTKPGETEEWHPNQQGRFPSNVIGEVEGYQQYFYCPKVSRKERMSFNNHPTVKPVELMKYLIKLVTPSNGRVLDPFSGSGSTGMAAVELGHEFVGCELDPNYVDISIRRIEGWNKKDIEFGKLFDAVE